METVKRIVKSKGFLAFWMGALLYFLTVLPNIIHNGGIMLYLGDFRSTTLPYTYHFHDRLFELGWDWTSGLGGDYLNQYSFANLFSPFTLIYMLLPRSVLIYAIPYVYALETGVGTLLAYIYLRRFVKDSNFAVIGGLVGYFAGFGFAQVIGRTVFGSAIEMKPVVIPIVAVLVIVVTLAGSIPAIRMLLRLRPAEVLHGR